MATLKAFQKPRGFTLPQDYVKKVDEETGNISFIKKGISEVEGFDKYTLGRYFTKQFKVLKPGEQELEEIAIDKPLCFICYIYVPQIASEETLYVVGSEFETLFSELLYFANIDQIRGKAIDMNALEKISFTSGVIKLIGHKYNQAHDTISYTVRKIDGIPFEVQDPDFVSCDVTEKEVLEVKLNLNGTPSAFHVHSDGKITRRGPEEIGSCSFALLKTVYDILVNEIERL